MQYDPLVEILNIAENSVEHAGKLGILGGRQPILVDFLWRPDLFSYKHYSPAELAKAWSLSLDTIRSLFRHEPGVLKIGKTGSRYRRGYITLRIPEEVAERVHRRLSA